MTSLKHKNNGKERPLGFCALFPPAMADPQWLPTWYRCSHSGTSQTRPNTSRDLLSLSPPRTCPPSVLCAVPRYSRNTSDRNHSSTLHMAYPQFKTDCTQRKACCSPIAALYQTTEKFLCFTTHQKVHDSHHMSDDHTQTLHNMSCILFYHRRHLQIHLLRTPS
jgi:hypothetical protein